jgi:nitroreductase
MSAGRSTVKPVRKPQKKMKGAEFSMDILEGIYTRRSIRHYTDQPIEREQLFEIIRAGMWAPSGLNNQPWRFVIVANEEVRAKLARQTKYDFIIEKAPASIAVFLDKSAMYHEVKDHLAMGACIENMLLAAHALGLGAVWLGEILKNTDAVRRLLGLPETLELMAVVAIGHPAEQKRSSSRKDLREVLLKEL